MQFDTLKSFEYHKFVRSTLSGDAGERPFYLANEQDFLRGAPVTYPSRNYFYGVGVAHENSRRLRIGVQDFELRAGTMLVIGPGIPRLWLDDNWALKNDTVFFTPEVFQAPFHSSFLFSLPFFRAGAQHIIALDATQYAFVTSLFGLMRQGQASTTVLSGLLYALLACVGGAYEQQHTARAATLTRAQHIVRGFGELLHRHYLEHKDVAFYAEQLHLTPKHLGEVIKQQTGKSTKTLVDDLVILEAQSLLKQTAMSVQEIVYWLGYEDPSHFVKVFRRRTGQTPLAYRRGN